MSVVPQPPPVDAAPEITRGPLPDPFDVRVTRALAEPSTDGALVEVALVAMGKLPDLNRRIEVRADGGVYAVARGRGGDWQVPFDRPLPARASARVSPAVAAGWVDELERAGFFDHPGYEANPRTQDGTFIIVRARRAGATHAVVLQNVRPPAITAVTDAIVAAAP